MLNRLAVNGHDAACGNSPEIIFQRYRALGPDQAAGWFAVFPSMTFFEGALSRAIRPLPTSRINTGGHLR